MAKMLTVALGALTFGAAIAGCASESDTGQDAFGSSQAALVDPVSAGGHAFDHALPTGNGRACATCHVEADAFTLKPSHVEARYAKLPRDANGRITSYASDPLFQQIDADDPSASELTFNRLRQGLARVVIDLPPNVTVDELPGARSIGLFRAVPTIANVAFTAPYLSDIRAATLQEQALGAAIGHMQPKKLPSQQTLDLIASYERDQFSSDRVRDLSRRLAAGEDPPRAERPLTAEEQLGKDAFDFRCTQCHGGPTLSRGPVTEFAPTTAVSVSRLNKANLPVYTFRFQNPDNTETVLQSPDPGRSLITGNPSVDTDFETFDVPTLYGISKTAPYFHDNSSATLEDVLAHYQEDFAFARSIGIPDPAVETPFSDEEMRLIVLYLKTL